MSIRRFSVDNCAARTEPYPTIKPGDKPATSKPAKASSKALTEKNSSEINTDKSSGNKADKVIPKSSFLDIELEGEPDRVRIYDTCSAIRQKITALLGKDNTKLESAIPGEFKKDGTPKPYTKAKFVEHIGGGSSRTLDTFIKARQIMGGAESATYPAAYRFFEKKRIFEGKKKTAGRLKCEEEWVAAFVVHVVILIFLERSPVCYHPSGLMSSALLLFYGLHGHF